MRFTSATLLLSIIAASAVASDWPTYKHNASRNARTDDPLTPPLNLRWSFVSPQPPQRAWPGPGGKTIEGLELLHRMRFDDVFHAVIADGCVYFGSSVDDHVYCVQAATGQVGGTFCTGAPVRVAPTVADGRAYAASDDGYAYCLDASDGSLIWKRRAGIKDERVLARGRMASRWPVRTSVLVDRGTAYFGAGTFPHENVYLYAVHAESGELVWNNNAISQQDAGRNDLTPQGYLLASDDLLFVPSGRTLPAAFDRADGQLVHKQRSGGKQVGGTDIVLTENQIYTIGEHEILAMNQDAGKILRKLPARQIVVDGETAYLTANRSVYCVDHAKYAAAYGDEEVLKRYRQLEEELQSHEAIQLQNAILERRHQTAEMSAELQELLDANQSGSERAAQLQAEIEANKSELHSLRARIREVGPLYNALRAEAELLVGIQWRTPLPHESALINVGNALVVGGEGEVVALSVETGEAIWREQVEGDVRGLSFADGFLTASTTAGRVYCFGDASHPAQNVMAIAFDDSSLFPEDEMTSVYAGAAEEILQQTGIVRGYCLVAGSEEGRLAYELARRSDLRICCVEQDLEKVRRSREAFRLAGLYGWRITVDHVDLSVLPHPNYFANLVVSDALLRGDSPPIGPEAIARHVKPVGGVICLLSQDANDEALESWLRATELTREGATIKQRGGCTLLTRGALPGADSWGHLYGNPANTSSNEDKRVRDGVSVLWYGDPGPSRMLNRHIGAVGPVSTNGRLFVQGDRSVMAYDAYNGTFLWETANSGALRTGVFQNYEPGNLVASDDSVFNVVRNECWELDAATGAVRRIYRLPDPRPGERMQWGYVAVADGRLYGTSTARDLLPEDRRRRGRPAERTATDSIFAYDVDSGALLWEHQGQSIAHATVAIGDGRVMFIDSSITPAQREALLQEDKSRLRELSGEARRVAEERLERYDVRLAVCLDAATGRELWAQPVDVTDCSEIGTGGGRLTLMYHDGHVVLCGANANGHYWKQFLEGEFKRRRLVVLSAETGELEWAKDANYRHRPIIVEDQIIAEPWAFKLATGEQITGTHPITGQETPWKFIRPGHHCGAISATPNMLFFRSGFTAYYDLLADSGTHHFGGHRLGCWINTIPANGLVLVPEASAGCACLFSLTSTIAFEPRADRQAWGVYTAEGETMPVRRLFINLGAPGDRREARGRLWLSYPRPSSRAGLDLPLSLGVDFADGGRFVQHSAESFAVDSEELAWVYASGARGLAELKLPLRNKGDGSAVYDVALHFVAESEDAAAIPISVALQGETVAEDLQLSVVSGKRQPLRQAFKAVAVEDELVLEVRRVGNAARGGNPPVLAGIEIQQSGP